MRVCIPKRNLAFALSWTGAFSCAYAALLVVKIERLVPASGPALDTIPAFLHYGSDFL